MVDVRLPVWVGSAMESSASRAVISQGFPGAPVKVQVLIQQVALSICVDASSQVVLMLRVQGPSFSDNGSKTVHQWVMRGQGLSGFGHGMGLSTVSTLLVSRFLAKTFIPAPQTIDSHTAFASKHHW